MIKLKNTKNVAILFAEFIAKSKFKYRFLNYWEEDNFSKSPHTTEELFKMFLKNENGCECLHKESCPNCLP